MKFFVQRDTFFKALQKVINVIPTKSTVEILYNILLSAKDNKLFITATDLEITQISWRDCEIEKEGEITIPGKLLLDIIRELPNLKIDFNTNEDNKILIKSDMGEYKLSGESKNEYPSTPTLESEKKVELDNTKLKKMIEKTIFACSTDHFRPALTGVLCQFLDQEYRMVATDGHRLVKIIDKSYSGDSINQDLIVPTKALNFVARNLPEDGKQHITISEKHVLFELPDTKIFTRIINEPYPDYERVIPKEFSKEMIIKRDNLISSVKRVSLFSNPITSQIRLNISDDVISISAQDVDFGGEANERIECKFNGDNLEIAYNSNYLMDILKHLDTTEIRLNFNDTDGPGLVFPYQVDDTDVDITMLIMPVRIN